MAWLYHDDVAWLAGWPLHCRDCWAPWAQPFRACALQGQTFVCPDSLLANPSNPGASSLHPPLRQTRKKGHPLGGLFCVSGGEGGSLSHTTPQTLAAQDLAPEAPT